VGIAPVLRVMATGRLLLHEEPDPARVERLREAIRRDAVLKNPPIVTPVSGDRAAVLDGANRVTALRDLGVPQVVVQTVSYGRPEITLSTWRHYVRQEGSSGLRQRLDEVPGLPITELSDADEADRRLAGREGAAAVVDSRGVVLVGVDGDPIVTANTLRRIVALYRGRSQIYRVDGGTWETLSDEYGPGAMVMFPPLTKDDILLIAARGGSLPTGISRHVIPGRALRLNTPLDWLVGSGEDAQVRLDALLHRRSLDHGVRYYAEPTYLYDE
jgi:hypothetical protein